MTPMFHSDLRELVALLSGIQEQIDGIRESLLSDSADDPRMAAEVEFLCDWITDACAGATDQAVILLWIQVAPDPASLH